jgi:hypothetical protein
MIVGCGRLQASDMPPAHEGTPMLGAGFRFSTYGPDYDPGPPYWVSVGEQMASRFANASPQGIWIVGNQSGRGTILTFPGSSDEPGIRFAAEDMNEEALTRFDASGVKVWLQVEPGAAPIAELIHIVLDQYGHHPCVLGVGIDVEWYLMREYREGKPVTDEEAAAWVTTARAHDARYRVFLKHWLIEKMPPTVRDGLLFVDDSQDFNSLDAMLDEFAAWGMAFAPAPVAFQFGYESDQPWWQALDDPPGDIGRQILDSVPNTEGLFWVDFTVLDVFPPPGSGGGYWDGGSGGIRASRRQQE